MNWIQRHILTELTRNSTRRYSQLKPRDIEGNLFMYHLKGLMKDGLVEKADTAYRLSTKGMQFIATFSLPLGKTRQQPTVLTAVVCKNDKNEYLFVRWHRQPNIGQISFPHGMVHFGETVADMASLELAEKAGLVADVVYEGDVYVRVMDNGEVHRHMLVHVFSASNIQSGREDELRSDVFESFWSPLENIKKEDCVPGFYEIAQLFDEGKISNLTEIVAGRM